MSVSVCRLVYAYVYASALSVVIQRSKIDKKVRRKCRESAEKVLRKCRETDIFAQQTLLFAWSSTSSSVTYIHTYIHTYTCIHTWENEWEKNEWESERENEREWERMLLCTFFFDTLWVIKSTHLRSVCVYVCEGVVVELSRRDESASWVGELSRRVEGRFEVSAKFHE